MKLWLSNGNADIHKLPLKQTVVNTKVPCTARTVVREQAKHTSPDLESIGKVEKSRQHSVANRDLSKSNVA